MQLKARNAGFPMCHFHHLPTALLKVDLQLLLLNILNIKYCLKTILLKVYTSHLLSLNWIFSCVSTGFK